MTVCKLVIAVALNELTELSVELRYIKNIAFLLGVAPHNFLLFLTLPVKMQLPLSSTAFTFKVELNSLEPPLPPPHPCCLGGSL